MRLSVTRRGVFFLCAAVGFGVLWVVLGVQGLSILALFFAACLVIALLAVVPIPRARRHRTAPLTLSAETTAPAVGATYAVHASGELRRGLGTVVASEWEIADHLAAPVRRIAPVHSGRDAPVHSGRGAPARRRASALARTAPSSASPAASDPLGFSASLTIAHRSRGPATTRIIAAELHDPLGLVRRSMRIDQRISVLVVPQLLDGERLRTGGAGGGDLGGAGDARRLATNRERAGLPGGDVREYLAGDPVRQINWKQSARQRELLVRLPEQESRRVVELRLDTDAAVYDTSESFEHAVSVVATEGVRQLRAGNDVRLRSGAADPELCHTPSQLLRALALVRIDEAGTA